MLKYLQSPDPLHTLTGYNQTQGILDQAEPNVALQLTASTNYRIHRDMRARLGQPGDSNLSASITMHQYKPTKTLLLGQVTITLTVMYSVHHTFSNVLMIIFLNLVKFCAVFYRKCTIWYQNLQESLAAVRL